MYDLPLFSATLSKIFSSSFNCFSRALSARAKKEFKIKLNKYVLHKHHA